MDVLQEIHEWSSSRPAWQRDALRRLVTTGALSDSDLEELVTQCKAAHGLAEPVASAPLTDRHIASRGTGTDVVQLAALSHHSGVNALAVDQMTFPWF